MIVHVTVRRRDASDPRSPEWVAGVFVPTAGSGNGWSLVFRVVSLTRNLALEEAMMWVKANVPGATVRVGEVGMKSMVYKLADHYSRHGQHQILVAVYGDQAVLYAQVQDSTAARIASALTGVRCAVLDPEWALSEDCLTYCWTLRRNPEFPGKRDWLGVLMTGISLAMKRAAPHLCPGGSVPYVDNRTKDYNTLEAFASALE